MFEKQNKIAFSPATSIGLSKRFDVDPQTIIEDSVYMEI